MGRACTCCWLVCFLIARSYLPACCVVAGCRFARCCLPVGWLSMEHTPPRGPSLRCEMNAQSDAMILALPPSCLKHAPSHPCLGGYATMWYRPKHFGMPGGLDPGACNRVTTRTASYFPDTLCGLLLPLPLQISPPCYTSEAMTSRSKTLCL